jgi:hypothetical protein
MKTVSVGIASLLLGAATLAALDFPPPAGAKTVTMAFDSYSWDNSAGWVKLKDVKTVRETYDPGGRLLTREIVHGDAVLIETTTYEYTDQGLLKTTYNGRNEIARRAVVVKTGSGTRESVFGADDALIAFYDTRYGPDGLPVQTDYADPEGGLVMRIRYVYDANGDCVAIAYSNPDGSAAFAASFTHESPDAAGNWTVRTEYDTYADVKNRPKHVVRRTVEYRE